MSRKDREVKRKNKENKQVVEKKEEPKSKLEIIASYILIGAGTIAILCIILFTILGEKKDEITKMFPDVPNENSLDLISYEEFQAKLNAKEEFQLVLVNEDQDKANYFVYCVDDLIKGYNETDGDNDEIIYLLDSSKLTSIEKKFFIRIDKDIFNEPVMIYYKNINEGASKNVARSSDTGYELDKFGNNYYYLLRAYIKDCFLDE